MKTLNVEAISDPTLCADSNGNNSLKDIIGHLSTKLTQLSNGKSVHYIELGPEPIKTSLLIKNIKSVAKDLFYTSIDINETSEQAMRDAVIPLLESSKHFNFIADDYRNVVRSQIEHGQHLTIITMLGFQEGNELPSTIGDLINAMGGQSTHILSEMQLFNKDRENQIFDFYANVNMLRFSQLVSKQQNYQLLDEDITKIVPLRFLDKLFQTAVTLQPVYKNDIFGYLMTNICIKYNLQQFRSIRLKYDCHVIYECISGDRSVIYQLAEYVSHSCVLSQKIS